MPLRFLQRIQDHLAYDSYRPAELGEVRRQMRVSDDDAEAFEQAVEMLAAEGKVEVGGDGRLRLPKFADEVEGR
ncbi:MAG: hypothetical protein ACKOV8_03470, partial [Phycisphaerales bacterium]